MIPLSCRPDAPPVVTAASDAGLTTVTVTGRVTRRTVTGFLEAVLAAVVVATEPVLLDVSDVPVDGPELDNAVAFLRLAAAGRGVLLAVLEPGPGLPRAGAPGSGMRSEAAAATQPGVPRARHAVASS